MQELAVIYCVIYSVTYFVICLCTNKDAVDAELCSPDLEASNVADNVCSTAMSEQNGACATESAVCDKPCHSIAQSPMSPQSPVSACDNIAKQTTPENGSSVEEPVVSKQLYTNTIN